MRPNVKREGGEQVVAIHLMEASAYYTHPKEELLKLHIRKVEKTNMTLDLLRDTSRDSVG